MHRFSDLSLPNDCEFSLFNNILCVTKWNWEYEDCERFQELAFEFIRKNRKLKIYIFCNHPRVFTLGRGNERDQDNLIEFNEAKDKLNFPLHRIHRGGGITFHYPGQWIFYPIISLGENYSLNQHICWILKTTKFTLEHKFKIPNLLAASKLVGIWKDRSKLASVGIGVKHFVTMHGLALNVELDQEMFDALKSIHPCGLNFETYKTINHYSKTNVLEFHKNWIQDHLVNGTSL